MMLDVARAGADARLVERDRFRNGGGQRPNPGKMPRAVGDRAARPVRDQEERFAPEVGPRIARDGEDIDVGGTDVRNPEAFGQRAMRKSGAVFDTAESLFRNRRSWATGFAEYRPPISPRCSRRRSSI